VSDWKPPKGFTLTRHEGHYIDERGFRVDDPATARRPLMPDGQEDVLHFFEDEPFKLSANDGTGPHASVEARKRALAGDPIMGWNANALPLPIEGGWVPPTYSLTDDKDDTPETRPAVVGAPSDTDQVAMLRAGIAAAEARIAEIEGGAA
jgi:hypothetical protein